LRIRAASLHSLRQQALNGPVLSDTQAVRHYLFAAMAHEIPEGLRAFYLDSRNHLLLEELIGRGGIAEITVSVRELIRVALDHGATALMLVHNHPSGNPAPSRADTDITRRLFQACRLFDIALHDHLIVARSGFYSFRAEGLL
jgi:DNA repair protein RadC